MEYPIHIENLGKNFYISPYGNRKILQRISDYVTSRKQKIVVFDSLNLQIKKGEIYGLLGPNAAGKTTLIRILSTTVLPERGKVLVNGCDVTDPKNKDKISGSIGVMLGERSRSFYWRLTAKQNMEFYADLYDVDKEKQQERIDYLLDFVGLKKRKDDYIYSFSTGMLNRLAIARAFIHSPKILLLDEFMGNIDPKAAFEIRNIVKKLAKMEGKTILFTTHNPYEAEFMSDRVGILHKGRVIAEGTPEELKRKYGNKDATINVRIEKFPKQRKKFLKDLENSKYIKNMAIENNVITMTTEKTGKCFESVIKKVNKAKIHDMEIIPPSLENAFIRIIEAEDGD